MKPRRRACISAVHKEKKPRYWTNEENEVYDCMVETYGYQAHRMQDLLRQAGINKTLTQIRTHEQKRLLRVAKQSPVTRSLLPKLCHIDDLLCFDEDYSLLFGSVTTELPPDPSFFALTEWE